MAVTLDEKTLRAANVRLCLECGKCSATCVIAKYNRSYSPRRLISRAVGAGRLPSRADLAVCLSCMACDGRCPSGVHFVDLIRELRRATFARTFAGNCPHGGAFQSLMTMMAADGLTQDRLGWLGDDLRVAREGRVAYFVGCAPYFDAFFADLGAQTLATARAAIKVLNASDITPVVSADERCCGHDLLWAGDDETFAKLARGNVAHFASLGVAEIIFDCPECYYTFQADYPKVVGPLPFTVRHMSQFVAAHAAALPFADGAGEAAVTFQDPCRLARFAGEVAAPRAALAAAGIPLVEMARAGRRAICCAGNGWLNCDRFSKEVQLERLREARATGAATLITACPKCEIHFRCAMADPKLGPEIKMEVRGLTAAVASRLKESK